MKRLAFLVAGGALFLLLGAMPVLADGGPHDLTANNGTTGINKDSCAGCHRAHTAQAPLLLVEDQSAMCLTCHGQTGAGATTDVMNGIQYKIGAARGGAVLGALRGGGFLNARIDSANAGRLSYTSSHGVSNLAVVPVLSTGAAVTSRHLNPAGSIASTVWGNGAIDSGAGPSMTLECASCHNPHGNGQYRILNPTPGDGTGGMTEAAGPANVTDAPLPAPGDVRNYTVIQGLAEEGHPSWFFLYASNLTAFGPTVGDYFHRRVPWDATATGSYMNDAPNGLPSTFNTQINVWCSQCHTRYLAVGTTPYKVDSGDAIYTYRHSNTKDKPCTTCHVAHGSNAVMTLDGESATMDYPGGATAPAGDSRLLKIDNRGTCQACHDPTGTVPAGTYIGPDPTPVVPR